MKKRGFLIILIIVLIAGFLVYREIKSSVRLSPDVSTEKKMCEPEDTGGPTCTTGKDAWYTCENGELSDYHPCDTGFLGLFPKEVCSEDKEGMARCVSKEIECKKEGEEKLSDVDCGIGACASKLIKKCVRVGPTTLEWRNQHDCGSKDKTCTEEMPPFWATEFKDKFSGKCSKDGVCLCNPGNKIEGFKLCGTKNTLGDCAGKIPFTTICTETNEWAMLDFGKECAKSTEYGTSYPVFKSGNGECVECVGTPEDPEPKIIEGKECTMFIRYDPIVTKKGECVNENNEPVCKCSPGDKIEKVLGGGCGDSKCDGVWMLSFVCNKNREYEEVKEEKYCSSRGRVLKDGRGQNTVCGGVCDEEGGLVYGEEGRVCHVVTKIDEKTGKPIATEQGTCKIYNVNRELYCDY